jgi:cytochrome c biogenesis protein CcmG/thiol:disulfide interchange protein DsbE
LIEEIGPNDPSGPAVRRGESTESETVATLTSLSGDAATGSGPDSDAGAAVGGSDGREQPPTTRAPARGVRSLLIGSVIAIAIVVLLLVGLGSHSGKGSPGPLVPVGSQAPQFSLPPLAGSAPIDLDALGRDVHHPVILNFFASWCTPCQKETPLLARTAAAEKAKGGPVRFVGVDVNDPSADALAFVEKAGIAYPVGVDQTFRVTSGLYGIDGLPQTFFIDADGKVVAHTLGAVDAAVLHSWMRKLDG